jgi:hypothetical protein
MPYFIYNKNSGNQIYKIAENDIDLNQLIGIGESYLVVSASETDFNSVKLNLKDILNYDNVSNKFVDNTWVFNQESLKEYIKNACNQVQYFLNANPSHPKYQQFLNYSNYLKSLIVEIIIPVNGSLNMSLEQYLQSIGQPYYSTLQIP